MAIYTIEDTTITNIADAIREKNGSTNKYNPSQMPDAIRAIETGGSSSDEWQPQPDWWDIESILENDTEDYAGKMIILFTDSYDKFDVYRCNANKVLTSDGVIYTDTSQSFFSHTWDTNKDKDCSLGYKTRYVIYYYSTEGIQIINDVVNMNKGILYVVSKNIILRTFQGAGFSNNQTIEAIKLINGYLHWGGGFSQSGLKKIISSNKNGVSSFANCKRLKTDLTEFDMSTVTNISNYFSYLYELITIGNIDTSQITSFAAAFRNAEYLKTIANIDFNSATNYTNVFLGCYALTNIINISNIKLTGLSFNDCKQLNHNSLIKILNALYDYASEESTGTYTLTLGATNLAKLTDEEKAIATNKGWTLS